MDIEAIINIPEKELVEQSCGSLHPKIHITIDGKLHVIDWTHFDLQDKLDLVREEMVRQYVKAHKEMVEEYAKKPAEQYIKVKEEKEEIYTCSEVSESMITFEERGRGKKRKVVETAIVVKNKKPKKILSCEVRRTRTRYITPLDEFMLRLWVPEKLKEVEALLGMEVDIYMEV